ncbi:uncharacterized protein LOC127252655 [Andrographis paniculata]|uniref:uncharacterized protein LOC127252655 n=1 Tax=Andrographis paniculata TaxID=175694 RepID=UPI0021E83B52|nr:uncharacterized protein LOC127252655 [Andrographis paniculata]
MASTVPAKSQPLHNFTLPHLKWNKDGHSSGHNHRRRSVKSPSRRSNPSSSASPVRQSPLRDSVAATPPRYHSPLRDSAASSPPRESPVHGNYLGKQTLTVGESSKSDGVRGGAKHHFPVFKDNTARHFSGRDFASESEDSARSRGAPFIEHRRSNPKNSALDATKIGVYATNSERAAQKFETKSKTKGAAADAVKRSKILIKIPCKTTKTEEENSPEEPPKVRGGSGGNNHEDCETDELQEEAKINNTATDEEIKTWNLRPRKPIRKSLNMSTSSMKNNGSSISEKNKNQSPLRNLHKRSAENGGAAAAGEKKEKRKLSISIALSKEEIEEDIFALTGLKPARRPKKRPKNIQRQVDCVFPGAWLQGITADSYKVSESSLKG